MSKQPLPEVRPPCPMIRVTRETIETSIRSDSAHCMISDSVKKQVPGATCVSSDLQTIRWTDKARGERYVFLTPPKAQRVLLAFDQGEDVAPFAFRVRLPQIVKSGTPVGQKKAAAKKAAKKAPAKKATKAKKASGTLGSGPSIGAGKATLAVSVGHGRDRGEVVVVGGKPAPLAVLAHNPNSRRYRRFGMRNAGQPTTA